MAVSTPKYRVVMPNVIVRCMEREDCKEVRRLIQELADFEKMPDGPQIDEKALERDGFDLEHPLFFGYVAEDPSDSSKLIGYAIFYYVYGTWTGRKMYLEDLFVTKDFRGHGVGDALFRKVVEKGIETDCCDMDFVVLEWNPAKDFYFAHGAADITNEESWHLFRLRTPQMKDLVQKAKTN